MGGRREGGGGGGAAESRMWSVRWGPRAEQSRSPPSTSLQLLGQGGPSDHSPNLPRLTAEAAGSHPQSEFDNI